MYKTLVLSSVTYAHKAQSILSRAGIRSTIDLAEKSGVSSASIAKLSKGANITTDVLLKICVAMNCTLEDIMETVKE